MKGLREMKYNQLVDFTSEVIEELRKKAYREGYEQGRFDERMESIEAPKGGRWAKKSSQEERDRIVERAKADIDGLAHDKDIYGNSYLSPNRFGCYAEFIVNRDKRTVVALLRGHFSETIHAKGIAKCAPNDCFNVHIGKAIALRRALGVEVPDEYLNAPQPTRVRKGDIVESTIHGKDHVFKVEVGSGEKPIAGKPHADAIYVKRAKIIDDSREEVSE